MRAERFRCLFLTRRNIQPGFFQPLAHGRIDQGISDRGIELTDDVLGRSFRRPNS
jgi:hypothetical protein